MGIAEHGTRDRLVASAAALGLAASLLLAYGGTASAQGTAAGGTLTDERFAALSQADQERILDPLRAVAAAVDEVGRGDASDVYTNVGLDPSAGRVNVYLTAPDRAAALLDEAKSLHPDIDTALVDVVAAPYSKARLDAARDRLVDEGVTVAARITSIAVAADGSGLEVATDASAAAPAAREGRAPAATPGRAVPAPDARAIAQAAGVPVALSTNGRDSEPATRFADVPGFYAGGYINLGGWNCTTGIPVRGNSGSQEYIITASHCGHTGVRVTNGNGVAEGTISDYHLGWDAAIYPVSDSSPREWDGPVSNSTTFALSGTAYSYDGDYVCQDGYTSGVVCGVKVDNDDVWTTLGAERYASFQARGVYGHQVNGADAVRGGDSGGLVFAVKGGTRQVRGIVSGSYGGNDNKLFWTEATDIYKAFKVHLAS